MKFLIIKFTLDWERTGVFLKSSSFLGCPEIQKVRNCPRIVLNKIKDNYCSSNTNFEQKKSPKLRINTATYVSHLNQLKWDNERPSLGFSKLQYSRDKWIPRLLALQGTSINHEGIIFNIYWPRHLLNKACVVKWSYV